jgi:hypothetical protein
VPLPHVLQSPQQFATQAEQRQQAVLGSALSVAIHMSLLSLLFLLMLPNEMSRLLWRAWGEEGGWLPPAFVSFGRSVALLLVILGCACFRVLKTFDELSL